MWFSRSCAYDCNLAPATPEQRAAGKRWLIILFAFKGIEVLSVVLCLLLSWQVPDVFTTGIVLGWVLGTVIGGWLFEALCFEMLARIMGDGDMWHRRYFLKKLAIVMAFAACIYFFT